MADKLTQQITDALSKAAAEAGGLPLYATKSEPGLFPSTAVAKSAAQRCLAEELIRVTRTDPRSKSPRELYGLTEKGWAFLLAAVNPKQILEDFVRLLEARQGEVGELLIVARQMADSLQGLKDAVARVLPQVTLSRVPEPPARHESGDLGLPEFCRPEHVITRELESPGLLERNGGALAVVSEKAELAAAVLNRLTDWAASARAGEDCPLPELYRSLTIREPLPTIGEFHDCLRQLHADGAVYLHPWPGPLYALPEPAFALLAGHNVAYYASLKRG